MSVPLNRTDVAKRNSKLEGELKSCKAELGKLRKQLQQMERQNTKNCRDLHNKLDKLLLQDNPSPTQTRQGIIPAINPIGYLESCFPEKNGTPRQGSITPTSKAKLKILWGTNPHHTLDGLEHFTHLWVVFYFHENGNIAVKSKVRPPQLSGEKKGLFSTRTPHRPNPIGLSLCKIDSIEQDTIYLSGVDIIDGTPILDIKPYIPAFDNPELHPLVHLYALPENKEITGNVGAAYFTSPTFVKNVHDKFTISYSDEAKNQLDKIVENGLHHCRFLSSALDIENAIAEVICNEPRSIYRRTECGNKPYGFIVDGMNVTCMINETGTVSIISIKEVSV